MHYRFASDATAATRELFLIVRSGGTDISILCNTLSVPASKVWDINLSPFMPPATTDNGTYFFANRTLAPAVVTENLTIDSNTSNLNAGDQYSIINISVIEYDM